MGKDVDAKGNTIPREDRLNQLKNLSKQDVYQLLLFESGSDEILKDMNKKLSSNFLKSKSIFVERQDSLTIQV